MRVRIRRLPQATRLEDFDLRKYQFEEGKVYDVAQRLGEMLVLYGFAEIEMRRRNRSTRPGGDDTSSTETGDLLNIGAGAVNDDVDVEPT